MSRVALENERILNSIFLSKINSFFDSRTGGRGGGQNPPLDDRNRALSIRTFGAISSKTTTKSVLRTKGRVFVFVVGLRSGFGALEEDLLLFFVRLFFGFFLSFSPPFSSLRSSFVSTRLDTKRRWVKKIRATRTTTRTNLQTENGKK